MRKCIANTFFNSNDVCRFIEGIALYYFINNVCVDFFVYVINFIFYKKTDKKHLTFLIRFMLYKEYKSSLSQTNICPKAFNFSEINL